MRRKCALLGLVALLALGACVTPPPAPTSPPPANPTEPGPRATAGSLPSRTEPAAPLPTDTAPASTATSPQAAPSAKTWTVVPLTGSEPITETTTPEPSIEPGMQPAITQAQADLARHLQISAGQISVISAQSVTWPDRSLGCPQPGMSYLQVLVDGVLIRLRVGGQVYEYHGGGGRPLFLCERRPGAKAVPQPPASSQPNQ
jgi:hypothetical protein